MALIRTGGAADYKKWFLQTSYNAGIDLAATFTNDGDDLQKALGQTATIEGLGVTVAASGQNVSVTFNKAVHLIYFNNGVKAEKDLAANTAHVGNNLYTENLVVTLQ